MAEAKSRFDVFISYRRSNVEFVKQLLTALENTERNAWVDWEDIPPGAENFTDEIINGIDGSNAFIPILSPDYLQSQYCLMELHRAVELKKRIIPIIYEKFEPRVPPDGIGHINWVYFTPHAGQTNTFEDAFPKVISALEVDLEHTREHTRILQRARDWERHNRDQGYLLRGSEIAASETWLANSGEKTPEPSKLHLDYIIASRTYEAQRTRRNLFIAVAVTIASIILAIFALLQRQEAIRQQGIAEEQRTIAVEQRIRAETQQKLSDSRRLAVQSLVALDNGQVDLALLLGLESNKSADTSEAIGSLVSAFEKNPYLEQYLYEHEGRLTAVAYHPTEPLMVTGAEDGTMVIWDMDTKTAIKHFQSDVPDYIWDIAIHPAGDFFAVAYGDASIELYDSHTGELLADALLEHADSVWSVTFSPDGSLMVSTSYDTDVFLWDVDSLMSDSPNYRYLQSEGEDSGAHDDGVWDAAFSPDGKRLATVGADNTLRIWDVETGKMLIDPIIAHDNWVLCVAWSPDGTRIVTGSADETIRFWDASSDESLGQPMGLPLSRHSDWIRKLVYSPDGQILVSVSEDDTVIFWNANNGRLLTDEPLRAHDNQVYGAAFDPTGDHLVTVGLDERVVLWNMTKPDLLGSLILTQNDEAHDVIYTSDGETIISLGYDANVYRTDLTSLSSTILFTPEIGRLIAASLSPDESQLAVVSDVGQLQLWDMNTASPLTEPIVAHNSSIFDVAYSPDGTQVATVSDDTSMIVWDVAGLINTNDFQFKTFADHADGVLAVAWHPDGKIIASASRDKTIKLWDVARGDVLASLEGHTSDIEDLVFSPDGNLLASAGRDNTIRLWDVQAALNGNLLPSEVLSGHTDWVLALAFSPDGTLLVSGGRDRAVILWDVADRQLIGQPLKNHDSWVWAVAMSPDGGQIVSAGRDAQVVIWDIQTNSWKNLACHIANRPLSPDEWEQFRPDADYEFTCEA